MENGPNSLPASTCFQLVECVCFGHGDMSKKRCEPPRLGALGTSSDGGIVPGEGHGMGRSLFTAVGLKNDAFSWWGLFLCIGLVVGGEGQTPSRTTA